jgi:hypothetical protein
MARMVLGVSSRHWSLKFTAASVCFYISASFIHFSDIPSDTSDPNIRPAQMAVGPSISGLALVEARHGAGISSGLSRIIAQLNSATDVQYATAPTHPAISRVHVTLCDKNAEDTLSHLIRARPRALMYTLNDGRVLTLFFLLFLLFLSFFLFPFHQRVSIPPGYRERGRERQSTT